MSTDNAATSAAAPSAACWCEEVPHHPSCEQAPMEMTKQEFVDAAVGGVEGSIGTYLFLVNDEGMTYEQALETVLDEAEESASCFAGIGSCGGGGCKHG